MLKSEYINAAAELFHVHPRDLVGHYKFDFLMKPRFALYKALRMRGWSYARIGRLLNRDHTTIMHGAKQAELAMQQDAGYAAKVQALVDFKLEPASALAEG